MMRVGFQLLVWAWVLTFFGIGLLGLMLFWVLVESRRRPPR